MTLAGIDKIAPGSLYPHQADGVAFLLSKRRVLLAVDSAISCLSSFASQLLSTIVWSAADYSYLNH